nr:MAG TPA: SARAH domain protein [Caudoviricetes sp.]
MFDMEKEIEKIRKKYRRRGIPDFELSAYLRAAKIMADMAQTDDRAALLYIRSVLSEKYGVKDSFTSDDIRHIFSQFLPKSSGETLPPLENKPFKTGHFVIIPNTDVESAAADLKSSTTKCST